MARLGPASYQATHGAFVAGGPGGPDGARLVDLAGLDLRLALNLDGGPVACQKVSAGGYRRDFCGRYELAVHGGRLQSLRPLADFRRSALPMALVAVPR